MLLLARLDRVQAVLLRDRLARHGIAAHLLNLHVQGAVGELPPEAALPQVWIADERDAERARAVLAAHEADVRRTGPPRFCGECGEENPVGFELCWCCGRAMPP
ncbi:MAG TPA: DUF2007 domain-containing protein [Burkholderiaceae bacterium]|nr:DUF2007 domain-containing protein [Burkholderiaceae bacterium]